MMEGMIYHRVTPLLKCMVLFLFIFTAKVLTSRPHESQDSRNSIQHQKPSHYVRTFTKYHHRRTIQWNNAEPSTDWSMTQDQPKVIGKRSIESPDEYLGSGSENVNQLDTESIKSVIDTLDTLVNKSEDEQEGSGSKLKKMKVKAAIIVTDAPTTLGPTISCLYKLHTVSLSVTPSYRDKKDEFVVENEIFNAGDVTEEILPTGEVVQVEKCTDPKSFCYTLWHQDTDGNTTVLGQGCWRSSQGDQDTCDKCITVTELLPGSKFCCCTENYCNANFTSIREEVAIKAESTMESSTYPNYSSIVASGILALVAVLLMAIVFRKVYCKRRELDKDDLSDGLDVEKGDVMGSGPDALATGLSCVDNLTLIEHIGQGKFGSVWRGSLGNTAVAVKLYSNPSAWHKEASVYAVPHLAHPNILRFYGSDVRAALGGGGRRLLVVELCTEPLRDRLVRAPLSWPEFAALAHGLAAALAHLHAHTATKPCIVHRDVNSGNVLIGADGAARLADLGLAQPLYPKRERAAPDRITEAGTLRYLSPEALEGALDLSGARAALCAVDVFALALVLWEMLWRCEGAHAAPPPPYAPPYSHLGLPARPTLAQMQNLVSRNKARPPLPRGPVADARALRLAADTCDECWDHDAEARLTAVCVEERMAELKTMLQAPGPVIHDNNLHAPAGAHPPPEADKNSNCRAPNGDITTALYCDPRRAPNDVTTPLYPDPHIGRNACIQRNTNTPLLDHKDIKEPRAIDCLSVARAPSRELDRLNEIRSYPRPLDYVPNDVSAPDDRGPKRTNLLQDREKPRWGIKRFFERKLNKAPKETEVKLIAENSGVVQNGRTRTSLVDGPSDRPANLALNDRYTFEPGTLSPPNRTLSPTMMELGADRRLPDEQVFAVIVPRARPEGSSESIKRSTTSSIKANSESEDSTVKKRLSDNRLIGSGRSSRASINLELQYIGDSPYDPSDCSSSEDEHLLLLSDGGSKITMQAIPRDRKYQNEVLKEASLPKANSFNKQNKYTNFDNEFSDPNDKENVNGYSGDNPVYFAALNGEIDTSELKILPSNSEQAPTPKPTLKSLSIKRQRSLEQVNSIFASAGDINLQNPAGRVKTPGDLPVAVRRARRDRALQKGRASDCNRLSLYDDRMMFGNSL